MSVLNMCFRRPLPHSLRRGVAWHPSVHVDEWLYGRVAQLYVGFCSVVDSWLGYRWEQRRPSKVCAGSILSYAGMALCIGLLPDIMHKL